MTAEVRPDVDPIAALNWTLACEESVCREGQPTATHLLTKSCGCQPFICSSCASDVVRKRDRVSDWWCVDCGTVTDNTRYGDIATVLPLRGTP